MDGQEQAELFERGSALFKRRDFAGARDLFHRAATGPVVEVAHSAQMYVSMCDRRLGNMAAPRTPDEQYAYAVSLMSQGRYPEAEPHLRGALAAHPDADHFHYALAVALGHSGDLAAAAEHLRRAIEIQPSNRAAARRDSDFASLAQQPPLRELLTGERG